MKALRPMDLQILNLIASKPEGIRPQEIAQILTISQELAYHYTKKLEHKGLILKKKEGFQVYIFLTGEGVKALSKPFITSSPTQPKPSEPFTPKAEPPAAKTGLQASLTRQEGYLLFYPFIATLPPTAPAIVIREAGLKAREVELTNNTQATFYIDGLTAMLLTTGIEIFAPHIYQSRSSPSIVSQDEAKRILDAEALKLEAKLSPYVNTKLRRIDKDTLYSERKRIELEEEEHPLAMAMPDEYKLKVHNPIDGKLEGLIDFSRTKKRPELAFVHRLLAPEQRDTTEMQFHKLFSGEINLSDINDVKQLAIENTMSIREERQFIKEHNAAIKEIHRFMKSINAERERARQRKLIS